MFGFKCTVCGDMLVREEKIYRCCNNHCFDIAKQGYVNLLQSQQSKRKRHGDDKLMIRSRTEFLDKGYYEPLKNTLCQKLNNYICENPKIIDAGCGDCYYTAEIEKTLERKNAVIMGIDISKDAMIAASKRSKTLMLAVASVFSLPVCDGCCDAVLNIFSPFAPDEYRRVLKSGGLLFRVTPLENHLIELKEKIYDTPYKNPSENTELEGFNLVDKAEIKYRINLNNKEDIENLFRMTPYYYKTSAKDQQKLMGLNEINITCEFAVIIYEKQ